MSPSPRTSDSIEVVGWEGQTWIPQLTLSLTFVFVRFGPEVGRRSPVFYSSLVLRFLPFSPLFSSPPAASVRFRQSLGGA